MVFGKGHDHVPPEEQDHTMSRDFSRDDPTPTRHTSSIDPDEHRSLKDKLKHPFPELREKLKETHIYDIKVKAIQAKHKVGKLENLFNSNHRHDEPGEIATDTKRTKIAEGHRFQSFAPEREGNRVKWYIDGRDYFWAVSVALERAKEVIYIEDWWLSPELFLRRPPYFNQEWRLDQVLKRAAERGVKIFVVVYKEVTAAVTCNSAHTKHALQALCPKGTPGYGNITVMRHPDHNVFENMGDMTFYWAHHEKFIVIDYDVAFIGGLDLCFGRWDTKQHPLADAHPAGVQNEIFPGQDFNNNRIMDFQSVEDWKSNELSKADYGRMPWHDVAMGLIGPCIYDIAEHFVLRWNFVKRDKYKRDERFPWLVLQGRQNENEDLIGVQRPKHPVGDYITHPLTPLSGKAGRPDQHHAGHTNASGSGNAQTQSQAADGAEREGTADSDYDDFHDAPEQPEDMHGQHDRGHGYTAEQHDRGHGIGDRMAQHGFHRPSYMGRDKSLPQVPQKIHGDQTDGHPSSVEDTQGGVTDQENDHVTGNNAKKEGVVSASGGLKAKQAGYSSHVVGNQESRAQGTVHAQLVRSSADWSSGILTEQSIQNAYCQIIRNAQHYVYIENQFFITATGDKQAPVHNQIGAAIADAIISAGKAGRKFRVILVIPAVPGFAGDLRDDAAAGTRAIMDYQYKSINRGEESIYGKVKAAGIDPTKYIFVFNLRSYDRLNKTPSMQKQEEKSGVTYQELQRAQAEEIMGSGVHGVKDEDSSSSEGADDSGNEEKEAAIDRKRQFEQHRTAAGGDETQQHKDIRSDDSIAKDAMLGESKVSEEEWAGRQPDNTEHGEDQNDREQETENFIQEELYIHGKVSNTSSPTASSIHTNISLQLLLVDDRIAICGSSNINDRSQLGFHDSELSMVMEDTLPLASIMDGQDFTAAHHAATLRRMLWREHLGLLPAQQLDASEDPNAQPPGDSDNDWHAGDEWDAFVRDPLDDKLWQAWCERAETNTQVFRHLFHADPDDNIKTFADYQAFLPRGDRKEGHLYDPNMPVENVRKALDKIKGHLVWMPLDFLEHQEMAEKGLAVNAWTESIYT